MNVTDSASKSSISSEERRYVQPRDDGADTRTEQEEEDWRDRSGAGGTKEVLRRNREPGESGDAMNMYDHISVHPDRTPATGPSPRAVYAYIDPAEVERFANWFRPPTTNSSMIVAKRYAAHVPRPASENASGRISTAVIVGEIGAIDWARAARSRARLGAGDERPARRQAASPQ